jgi:hypothetical protein
LCALSAVAVLLGGELTMRSMFMFLSYAI